MPTTSVSISIKQKRLLNKQEAAEYCGMKHKGFESLCHVRPTILPSGKLLYDDLDLDQWIDGLKSQDTQNDDEIIARLK